MIDHWPPRNKSSTKHSRFIGLFSCFSFSWSSSLLRAFSWTLPAREWAPGRALVIPRELSCKLWSFERYLTAAVCHLPAVISYEVIILSFSRGSRARGWWCTKGKGKVNRCRPSLDLEQRNNNLTDRDSREESLWTWRSIPWLISNPRDEDKFHVNRMKGILLDVFFFSSLVPCQGILELISTSNEPQVWR